MIITTNALDYFPRLLEKKCIYIFSLFIYLLLAELGLHCCAQASSSCSNQGLHSSCGASYFCGFLLQSTCSRAHRPQELGHVGSGVLAPRL